MNCAGCHGYDLSGGMGPDLTDNSWLYGARPGEIFHTIAEGTPRGMPSWKDQLTPEQIWQLVTFIQSKQAN
jgi:cytochrome c oxidase cbb3-type subunit 3